VLGLVVGAAGGVAGGGVVFFCSSLQPAIIPAPSSAIVKTVFFMVISFRGLGRNLLRPHTRRIVRLNAANVTEFTLPRNANLTSRQETLTADRMRKTLPRFAALRCISIMTPFDCPGSNSHD
jgi:hypothetical protein